MLGTKHKPCTSLAHKLWAGVARHRASVRMRSNLGQAGQISHGSIEADRSQEGIYSTKVGQRLICLPFRMEPSVSDDRGIGFQNAKTGEVERLLAAAAVKRRRWDDSVKRV